MKNKDIIIITLINSGSMCDDCLSEVAGITPRQQINALCNQLESDDRFIERPQGVCPECKKEKIINQLKCNQSLLKKALLLGEGI